MNLHALKLFYEAASRGSVTRAAEALHISQPAVTAQIRNLEQELGVALLASQGRGIRLTEAGEMLHGCAAKLFALEQEMDARIADYRQGVQGKLRIAATYLPANHLLPGWMAAFKQLHERIELTLTTANSRSAYEKLLHYEADLAVIGGSKEAPAGVTREELLEDELWFVVPAGHRLAGALVSLAEMMKEPFIVREEGSSTREKLLALCRLHNLAPPRVGLQFNGPNETIRAVMAGYGANLLSALEVSEYIRQGAVARVQVDGVRLANPIAVCRRSGEELSPSAGQFLAFAKEQMLSLDAGNDGNAG
ncbi:LysR family transcriptional regulator [Paenibacillus doosanensis]|uniref:LysR family transcriptional regulator n=1 Tax=Paenibacillus doosanensis TaxID=1229154 RepID=UPI0021804F01|nr:LysR family transcriptional regulator [Paenibacillus doosanensis]MCS7462259.1 LysR family transcriptional regulator [Paenibacillus doosanensis]